MNPCHRVITLFASHSIPNAPTNGDTIPRASKSLPPSIARILLFVYSPCRSEDSSLSNIQLSTSASRFFFESQISETCKPKVLPSFNLAQNLQSKHTQNTLMHHLVYPQAQLGNSSYVIKKLISGTPVLDWKLSRFKNDCFKDKDTAVIARSTSLSPSHFSSCLRLFPHPGLLCSSVWHTSWPSSSPTEP